MFLDYVRLENESRTEVAKASQPFLHPEMTRCGVAEVPLRFAKVATETIYRLTHALHITRLSLKFLSRTRRLASEVGDVSQL